MPFLKDEKHYTIRSLSVNYCAGSREGLHAHNWFQFLYARDGIVRADMADQTWLVPPQRGLLIPPGLPHRLYMSGALKLRTLYLNPTISALRGYDQPHSINVSGLLREVILRICEIGMLDERESYDQGLGELVLHEFVRAEQNTLSIRQPEHPKAARIAESLMDDDNRSLDAICSDAATSRRTAERLFRIETGLSLGKWKQIATGYKAMALLSQGETIDEVAEHCGFASRSSFHMSFRQIFGMTPKQFIVEIGGVRS